LRLGHLYHLAHLKGEAFAYERHWRAWKKDAAITRLPIAYTAAKVRVHLHEVIAEQSVMVARALLVYTRRLLAER